MTSGIATRIPPAPISPNASSWSLIPCAIAFQVACVTAAASTTRVTDSGRAAACIEGS